jgi:hypothetical protein
MALARTPFRGLSSGWWSKLLLALLVLFYLFYVAGTLATRGLFDYMGSDFVSFRSASEIVWKHGFAQVYDLGLQERYQLQVCQAYAADPGRCATAPTFYLPAFVLLFLPLSLLPPVPGFILWTVLNLLVLGFYLWRFMRAVGLGDRGTLLAMALLSGPVFANWFFGQASLWLLICLGEFLLAGTCGKDLYPSWPTSFARTGETSWRRTARKLLARFGSFLGSIVGGKEFRAGLWLGGLLLKPQILILLLPGLLIGRRFKVLAGFALAAAVVLALSLLLAGPQGLLEYGKLLLNASGDMATTNPWVMMNWRSLATNLEVLLPSRFAWGLAYGGMGLTALAGLSLWLRPATIPSVRFDTAMLGTYAASSAVTWHSHTNLAAPLIVLLLLLAKQGLSRAAVDVWFFVPALLFPIAFFTVPAIAHNLAGLGLFALNLYLVGWAVWALWRPQPTPHR